MQSVRQRYYSEPIFRTLVDVMVAHINDCKFTPSEIRDAAILASIIYAEMNTYSLPIVLRHHLDELEKWMDNNERPT